MGRRTGSARNGGAAARTNRSGASTRRTMRTRCQPTALPHDRSRQKGKVESKIAETRKRQRSASAWPGNPATPTGGAVHDGLRLDMVDAVDPGLKAAHLDD